MAECLSWLLSLVVKASRLSNDPALVTTCFVFNGVFRPINVSRIVRKLSPQACSFFHTNRVSSCMALSCNGTLYNIYTFGRRLEKFLHLYSLVWIRPIVNILYVTWLTSINISCHKHLHLLCYSNLKIAFFFMPPFVIHRPFHLKHLKLSCIGLIGLQLDRDIERLNIS